VGHNDRLQWSAGKLSITFDGEENWPMIPSMLTNNILCSPAAHPNVHNGAGGAVQHSGELASGDLDSGGSGELPASKKKRMAQRINEQTQADNQCATAETSAARSATSSSSLFYLLSTSQTGGTPT
jgi:hypothetical protein